MSEDTLISFVSHSVIHLQTWILFLQDYFTSMPILCSEYTNALLLWYLCEVQLQTKSSSVNQMYIVVQVSAGCAGSPCAFGCTSLGGNNFQCGCPTGYQRIGQVCVYFCVKPFTYSFRNCLHALKMHIRAYGWWWWWWWW